MNEEAVKQYYADLEAREAAHVALAIDPATLVAEKQYYAFRTKCYGTIHVIDGQLVSDEGQVWMTIDDPNWQGACRWIYVDELEPWPQ